ncbi:cilia- and flagella-associated protein 77 isoform X2 [Aplysia californica]|uniref:Cilia- and flagella-associated protein 77 isoform X2 n=1 Tax=Aplysia californica TaxID=6500 RepID=A0ABM0JSW1_APLCA|nr:cilia- and flagella-associated protein 77 isoform X2 [Aplysia californica]
MATQMEGPFDFTATNVLGDQRNTMLYNELHLRDKVGSVKTRGFELPGKHFTYGLPNDRRDYTAAHALRGWTGTYLPKGGATKSKSATERDFMSLNRASIAAGLVKAPENSDYRATHDIRRLPFDQKEMAGKMRSRRLPPTMVFGIPSRPSTPIFDLLEHKYQDKWIKDRQHQLSAQRSAEIKASRGTGIIYETRASLLRTYQNPVEPAPLWQLPRFTKSAKPHIQTFRTNRAKSDAFGNLETDKIARQGDFGTGIYEPAKN